MSKLPSITKNNQDKKPEDLIEIRGFNVVDFRSNNNTSFLIIGKYLEYDPGKYDLPVKMDRVGAYDLAIDIIKENPLLLFSFFKKRFNLDGGDGNGKEKKKTTEKESERVLP